MPERLEPEHWEAATRSARDVAVLLPIVVVLLLLPPIILVFSAPHFVGGIPLIVVYLYGVWAASVFIAFLVARRLARAEANARDTPSSDY
jgi:uncharacterized membrane protein YdjX (TVP38/TMEM64 family)